MREKSALNLVFDAPPLLGLHGPTAVPRAALRRWQAALRVADPHGQGRLEGIFKGGIKS